MEPAAAHQIQGVFSGLPHQADGDRFAVHRIRHPLKFRLLQVARVQTLTPAFLRITFTGESPGDLDGFVSASFDDHVKLFFPEPGSDKPMIPTLGPDGPVFAAGRRPLARDFTPRRFDAAARELDIEFALHADGPATAWARMATPGQLLGMGGPRGSMVIPMTFDWHLLVGDECAMPAIARRLEELPPDAWALALIEVRDTAGQPDFGPSERRVTWCHRGPSGERGSALMHALERLALPTGEGYAWAAGESSVIRAVRTCLRNQRGLDKRRMHAASYWKSGHQAVHEQLDD